MCILFGFFLFRNTTFSECILFGIHSFQCVIFSEIILFEQKQHIDITNITNILKNISEKNTHLVRKDYTPKRIFSENIHFRINNFPKSRIRIDYTPNKLSTPSSFMFLTVYIFYFSVRLINSIP